jgi:hypothetical protein
MLGELEHFLAMVRQEVLVEVWLAVAAAQHTKPIELVWVAMVCRVLLLEP